MRLLASDPYASPETARTLNVELAPLENVLAQADFVTLHTALTSGTRGLIGAHELALMKPGARLINCARGGVVDEEALLDALEIGPVAGAALDVFSAEPPREGSAARRLIEHPQVVATPHLGASTEEAQVNVAVDVAEQIVELLSGGSARSAVNAPLILPDTLAQLQPWMRLVETLGRLYTQLHPGPLHQMELSVSGDIAQFDTRPLTAALIKGLLESVSEAHVNLVNAPILARDWGLVVTERRTPAHAQYSNLVSLEAQEDGGGQVNTLAATITWGEERVVRVDDYLTDFVPSGHVLFCHNVDRPGMIGRVGTILGDVGVNIGHMDVGPLAGRLPSRTRASGGEALMILSIDEAAPPEAIERIRQTESIRGIVSVAL
jgi:D-3-phosphoglycerate dehydrogenase